jgi:pimeloyl-ACP methyl ester carboxylesterase
LEIRRFYTDCRFGQLHYRKAMPAHQVESTRPPLLCFHQSPQSSRVFTEVLKDLGKDRAVFAPDTPGFGESDPPTEPPSIEDFADAMEALIEAEDIQSFDVLGYHTGVLIATELTLRHPGMVRRLVLIGLPVLEQAEIDAFFEQPWPVPMEEDGSHISAEWKRSVSWAGPGMTLPLIQRGFVDKLKAGDRAFWGGRAAMLYPFGEKLPQISQSILAIGPKDDLWEISTRAEVLIQNGSFERWPSHGFGLFDVASTEINSKLRSHFDSECIGTGVKS